MLGDLFSGGAEWKTLDKSFELGGFGLGR